LTTSPHLVVFFFQAEDGIRDLYVTGVQTCALPISKRFEVVAADQREAFRPEGDDVAALRDARGPVLSIVVALDVRERRDHLAREIGRASCRERWWRVVGAGAL